MVDSGYCPALHPLNWLHNLDYSGGGITDNGAHFVETAHRTVTITHLANNAIRLGRPPVKWDPENEAILGDPEASRMLGRPQRKAWALV